MICSMPDSVCCMRCMFGCGTPAKPQVSRVQPWRSLRLLPALLYWHERRVLLFCDEARKRLVFRVGIMYQPCSPLQSVFKFRPAV